MLTKWCDLANVPKLTWHGTRVGVAIEASLSGASIDEICDHTDWADPRMARYYMKIVQVLSPDSLPSRLAKKRRTRVSTTVPSVLSRADLQAAADAMYPIFANPANVTALEALVDTDV